LLASSAQAGDNRRDSTFFQEKPMARRRTKVFLYCFVFLSFFLACCSLVFLVLWPSDQQKQRTVYKAIDRDTVVAYEKLGATYITMGIAIPPSQYDGYSEGAGLPGFRFNSLPQSKLPEVSVPFGIVMTTGHDGRTSVTDATMKDLSGLRNLTALYLHCDCKQVTEAGLEKLAGLPNLNTLSVQGGSPFWPGGGLTLKGLAALQNLTALDLRGEEVTDAGLKEVARLKNISILDLTRTRVKDGGWQEVIVGGVYKQTRPMQVTDGRLKELAPLKNLTMLYLDETQVTDEGLRSLRELGLLHAALLGAGRAEAKGKDGARPRSEVEVVALNLAMTQVTDAGLKELTGLKNLTTLDLSATRVTREGAAKLRKDLPGCNITLSVSN
jgi:hypothetical protein